MILGAKHVENPFIEFGQRSTIIYFIYFLVLTPVVTVLENISFKISDFNYTLESDNDIDFNKYDTKILFYKSIFRLTPNYS